jgi:tetratricopeptide (TPR) repeat protein
MNVELTASGQIATISGTAEGDGSFEFDGIAPGQYQLRVTNSGGQLMHEEPVFVGTGNQNLSIRVSNRTSASGSAEGTVSLRRLQHKVPGNAQKEYEKGRQASVKGDQSKAIDHLQKAAQIDPQFSDAYNGLGVVHMALGQTQMASEEFQQAINLEPDHDQAVANLSIALFRLQRFRDAEQVARLSLKLNPTRSKLRYVLGMSIVTDGGDKTEALFNLQRAAADVPEAHLLAAKLLAESGRRDEAAKHLDDYLRTAPQSGISRDKVEAWLAQLQQ